MIPAKVLQDFDALPPDLQVQVFDFIEFVKAKHQQKVQNSPQSLGVSPTIGLGDRMANYFKDIPPANCMEEELFIPHREHYPPVSFDE